MQDTELSKCRPRSITVNQLSNASNTLAKARLGDDGGVIVAVTVTLHLYIFCSGEALELKLKAAFIYIP